MESSISLTPSAQGRAGHNILKSSQIISAWHVPVVMHAAMIFLVPFLAFTWMQDVPFERKEHTRRCIRRIWQSFKLSFLYIEILQYMIWSAPWLTFSNDITLTNVIIIILEGNDNFQRGCQKVFVVLVEVQDTDPCLRGLYPYTWIGSRACKLCNVLNIQCVSMHVFRMSHLSMELSDYTYRISYTTPVQHCSNSEIQVTILVVFGPASKQIKKLRSSKRALR